MTGPWHSLFSAVPSLKQFNDKIHLIYAGTATEHALVARSVQDVVKEIRAAKARGKTKFVFAGSAETVLLPICKKIETIVNLIPEIPAQDFFYAVAGTYQAEQDYKDVVAQNNFKKPCHIISTSQFEFTTFANLRWFSTVYQSEYIPAIRPKKFLCFNKVHREHRTRLVVRMLQTGLVNAGHYSFEGSTPNWLADTLRDFNWEPYIRETLRHNAHKFPMRLNITEKRQNPVDLQLDDVRYFLESYFSIVTETMFYRKEEEDGKKHIYMDGTSGIFITEKTYKVMGFKHPFIIFGQPGILKVLRNDGYKTFAPYIDESYDDELDSDKRFEMLWNEINRLCNFTDEQWMEWQQAVRPIIDHNYNVITTKTNFISCDEQRLHQLFSS